jgi:hypothetical protein
VLEALLLVLDCSVIAGTGAGTMPLFIESGKIMIIISLLRWLGGLPEVGQSRMTMHLKLPMSFMPICSKNPSLMPPNYALHAAVQKLREERNHSSIGYHSYSD